jgi:hypothetical protein
MKNLFNSLYTRVFRNGNRVEIYFPIKKINDNYEFYLLIKDDGKYTFSRQEQNFYQFSDLMRLALTMNIEGQTRKQAFIKAIFLLMAHKIIK